MSTSPDLFLDTSASSHRARPSTLERVEEQLGMWLYYQETADWLQRMASDAPGRVQQRVDEGMPVDVELQHGAELVSAEQVVEKVENVVDDSTTRKYHLTREELETLVERVDSTEELEEYLDARDRERTSAVDEFVDSEEMASFKIGKITYTVAGLLALGFPKTALAALLAGYGSKKVLEKYGGEIREWIHGPFREHVGLSSQTESRDEESGQSDDDSGFLGVF